MCEIEKGSKRRAVVNYKSDFVTFNAVARLGS